MIIHLSLRVMLSVQSAPQTGGGTQAGVDVVDWRKEVLGARVREAAIDTVC